MEKVAIVTAASKGMGAACTRELHARGYKLVLMARGKEVHDLAGELNATAVEGSVTERDDLVRLVDTAIERYGRIDAVVNNTGHPPKGDLPDLSETDWRQGFDLVLLNVINMTQLITPVMLKQGSGAYVNISTFAAFEPSPRFPVSSVLRAALGSYAKLYADRYATDGIRMNNVLPGFMDSYEVSPEVLKQIPAGRPGKVSELAKTVAFLLSDDAGYITGQNIRVDGGITRSV